MATSTHSIAAASYTELLCFSNYPRNRIIYRTCKTTFEFAGAICAKFIGRSPQILQAGSLARIHKRNILMQTKGTGIIYLINPSQNRSQLCT